MKSSKEIAIYLTSGGAIFLEYTGDNWQQLLDAADSQLRWSTISGRTIQLTHITYFEVLEREEN